MSKYKIGDRVVTTRGFFEHHGTIVDILHKGTKMYPDLPYNDDIRNPKLNVDHYLLECDDTDGGKIYVFDECIVPE